MSSFPVPGVDGTFRSTTPQLKVPDTIASSAEPLLAEIPDWTYTKFSVFDTLHSKLGIAAFSAMMAFAILSYINPPFVQERDGNEIEIRKPSMNAVGGLSITVFFIILVISIR